METINTNNLFGLFEAMLGEDESLSFNVKRNDKGLEVTVVPNLGNAPEDMPEDAQKYRASLATPMLIIESAGELDQNFASMLTRYSEARGKVKSAFEELLTSMDYSAKSMTNEANSQSEGKSNKADKSTGKSGGGKKSSAEKPAAATTDATPDSL